MTPDDRPPARPAADLPPGVLVVRPGPGANCSSIGSVVDMLFVAGTLGAAIAAALAATLPREAPPPPAPPHPPVAPSFDEDDDAG